MMNQRIIPSRFCATLSAGALALALASPAWSADPAGQAEMQLAKNHINSLKKPSPALSGKALQAFKNREKAFRAREKQKPPKPVTGKQLKDLCNKDKECREQMRFIEKEEKKKRKSGSLDIGWPDLASALNPFQVKEAKAAHLPLLTLVPCDLSTTFLVPSWKAAAFINRTRVYGRNNFPFYSPTKTKKGTEMGIDLWVPKLGWYLFTFEYYDYSREGAGFSYFVNGIKKTYYHPPKPAYGKGNFQYWNYLEAGRHTLLLYTWSGAYDYRRVTIFAYK